MEALSSSTMLDNEDKALKSLLDAFGSVFSREDIAFTYCKAGRDANRASELLAGKRANLSSDTPDVSKSFQENEIPSTFSDTGEFRNLRYSSNNGDSKAIKSKGNPVSVGSVSSMLGKKYVWRPRNNITPTETKSIEAKENKLSGSVILPGESLVKKDDKPPVSDVFVVKEVSSTFSTNGNGNSKALISKKYVWRPRNNKKPDGTKPVEVSVNKLSGSLCSGQSLTQRDEDAHLNRDIENFLFEMLGQGFQLERSAIREVLGLCGYDMKQSLEVLLDLTAVTLDKRNGCYEGSNLNSNSETLPSQYEVQNQKFVKSGSRTGRTYGISSKQSAERYEQQKEVLTSLFHVPERFDSSVGASVLKSVGKSMGYGTVVAEPLKDDEQGHKAEVIIQHLDNMKDEVHEDEYQILRKAVMEYRGTMKEYYKAAAEAFAGNNRARAGILLEKGRYFYNKAREADEESAQQIFETSCEDVAIQEGISLDLQHHDAKESIQLLKSHLRSLCGITTIKNLTIMVGTTEQDVEKRKRLVKKLLEKEDINWIEDHNLGTIMIRLDEINPKLLSFARNK